MKPLVLLFSLAALPLFAQNNILRGIVTYQNTGVAVKGVKISELGMAVSGLSDDDGVFELKFPGKKPGDVVTLFVRLDGHEVIGKLNATSFSEAIRADPAQVVSVVVVRSAERKANEEKLRNAVDKRLSEQNQLINSLLIRLDSLSTSPDERKALSEQIQTLSREVELLTVSRDELVRRMAETDLSQASGMVKKAFEEFNKGNIAEAIAMMPDDKLDAFMASAREAFRLGVENYMVKARFLTADLKFGEAKSNYMKAIAADSLNLENLSEVGYFFAEQEDIQSAIQFYRKSLALASSDDTRAKCLNNLANALSDNHLFIEAEVAYREALEIRRVLAKINPDTFLPAMAFTLNNLGVLLADIENFEEAETVHQEALKIYQDLAQKDSSRFLPSVAWSLNNLGNLLSGADAEHAYQEALAIRRILSEKQPDIHLPYVASILNNLGIFYSDNQLPEKAETAFKEAIEIQTELTSKNPDAYSNKLARTLNNYAIFKWECQKYVEAEAVQREALAIYKLIVAKFPGNSDAKQRMAIGYGNLAWHCIFNQKPQEAEAAAKKGLAADASEEWIYTNLALAFLFQGKWDEAEAIYAERKEQPYPQDTAKTWRQAFLEDLDALEKEGITHPDIVKVRTLLRD